MKRHFHNSQTLGIDYAKYKEGTVLISDSKTGLYVKTKKGILKILEIQGENAKRMPTEDFLRGNKIEEGEIFS